MEFGQLTHHDERVVFDLVQTTFDEASFEGIFFSSEEGSALGISANFEIGEGSFEVRNGFSALRLFTVATERKVGVRCELHDVLGFFWRVALVAELQNASAAIVDEHDDRFGISKARRDDDVLAPFIECEVFSLAHDAVANDLRYGDTDLGVFVDEVCALSNVGVARHQQHRDPRLEELARTGEEKQREKNTYCGSDCEHPPTAASDSPVVAEFDVIFVHVSSCQPSRLRSRRGEFPKSKDSLDSRAPSWMTIGLAKRLRRQ